MGNVILTRRFAVQEQEQEQGSVLSLTNGLQIYLNAADTSSYTSGTTWHDISGNNRDFIFTSTPNKSSDQGNTYLDMQNRRARGPASNSVGITNSSGYTIFLVARVPTTSSPNHAFKFYSANGSSDGDDRGIAVHMPWTNGSVYFDQGGCCDADQRLYGPWGASTSSWYMWTFRSTVSTRSVFRNTSRFLHTTTNARNINLDSGQIDIGLSNASNYDWHGWLGAFLVYNRGLSDSEIDIVYNDLKAYFNI